MIKAPKKLIEVALPLDDINREAAREKSIRHGHPSTLHLWWARRPLAAARAVIFAQMVNDPGYERSLGRGVNKELAAKKREELFDIIRDLVKWENSNDEKVLERARAAIRESWRETCELNKGQPGFDPDKLPAFHDPFAGGGAIPLEAQRLGLESYASDLNPVPVMINKAMIEIPPKFSGRKPIGPVPVGEPEPMATKEWLNASGLAEDIRRYGVWIRDQVKAKIAHFYPQVEVTREMAKDRPDLEPYVGRRLTVVAWLWAHTVKSPDPQFSSCEVPLVSNFVLSKKADKTAYIKTVVGQGGDWHFKVCVGPIPSDAENGTKTGGAGSNFTCILSGTPISGDYIHDLGWEGKIGSRLMAIVCKGDKERIFLDPIASHENIAKEAMPTWLPSGNVPPRLTGGTCRYYGYDTWDKLFTARQLLAMDELCGLLPKAREDAIRRGIAEGLSNDGIGLADGGSGATAYGDALAIYLTFGVSRLADNYNAFCRWKSSKTEVCHAFGRQAISMAWDYAESNFFSGMTGDYLTSLGSIIKVLE